MDRLPILKRYAYGVGHVQNDLCASLWFSYLLIYFHTVLSFSNSMAGNLMLLGQIVDAISTPLVGYESDKTSTRFYGKRKTWHLLGTICVAVSFPFLFNPCITCNDSPDWARFIYYAPFVAIFQFGWASTQISHLALIPELSPNESTRVELNAIRYAFTVIANIFVYGLTWFLLDLFSGSIPANDTEQSLSPDDIPTFTKLSAIVIGTGIVFSSIFHIGTKENPGRALQESTHLINGHLSEQRQMSWKSWLIEPQFYLIALLYMCTRLMVNISQVYIPLFLHDTLHLDKIYIAIIPLIIYISGFLTSLFMKLINAFIGRKLTYMFGALMVIAFSTSLWFRNIGNGIYASAVLIGAGGSTVLVTSLSMTADLIGQNTESGAFVYGAMSFTDKLSNGVAIILIQDFHPCVTCCVECKWYYQYIMVFVPGGFAVFALIILAILAPQKIGKRRRDTHLNNVAGSESTNEDKNHSEHTSLLSDEIIETHGSINT